MAYNCTGIDHVCLNTMEVDKAKEFYMKYFGFTCKTDFQGQIYRMVILTKGEFCLEIVNETPNPAMGPFDHICFLVTGLHEMLDVLKEAGCEIEDEGAPCDAYNADGVLLYSMKYLKGLVGERIELYEKFRPDLYENQ